MDSYKIIKYPLQTEKGVKLMQEQNKLVFIVDPKAKKPEIKKALEELFKVRILDVKTFFSFKGEKKAYVKFSPEKPAIDIATELGLI